MGLNRELCAINFKKLYTLVITQQSTDTLMILRFFINAIGMFSQQLCELILTLQVSRGVKPLNPDEIIVEEPVNVTSEKELKIIYLALAAPFKTINTEYVKNWARQRLNTLFSTMSLKSDDLDALASWGPLTTYSNMMRGDTQFLTIVKDYIDKCE